MRLIAKLQLPANQSECRASRLVPHCFGLRLSPFRSSLLFNSRHPQPAFRRNAGPHLIWSLLFVLLSAFHPRIAQTAVAQSDSPIPTTIPLPQQNEASPDSLDAKVDALIEQMSVADRVGQLFVITFQGDDVQFDSDITELIYAYRVGGIVLDPAYGNLKNARSAETPRHVATLVNQLQALTFGVLLPREDALTQTDNSWPSHLVQMEDETGVAPPGLPLFMAVQQGGDNLPATSLRQGFAPLPSQMALGATWDPELTAQVGEAVGRDLKSVGVNMLLGPSLDVLTQPRPDTVGSLGVHMFGGDPHWVGRLGRAYIEGVHRGSDGAVATIASHFPGQGDTDRVPDEEVATIQRSAEEMAQTVLPPFRAVTDSSSTILADDGDPGATDGLMSSHMRYPAFQGSSSGRGAPLSMSPELSTILQQDAFSDWRTNGGIMMSNSLGSPAILRHYDATQDEFPYRRIAFEAFSAGNDLLFLSNFGLDGDWEREKQNIKATIGFFQDKYQADDTFADQVDEALRRILRLKLGLYTDRDESGSRIELGSVGELPASPVIPVERVLVTEADLASPTDEATLNSADAVGQVAQKSITVLHPEVANLSDALPAPPGGDEKILIFTDSRLLKECDECVAEAAIGPDQMADTMLQLYGPNATDQVEPAQIDSLTFSELAELLDLELAVASESTDETAALPEVEEAPLPDLEAEPAEAAVENASDAPAPETEPVLDKSAKVNQLIQDADWLIFLMLDVDEANHPSSDVVKRFLRQREDQLADKRVVVFGLNAPYFLDATEISKLTSYFGLYSKTQPFIETAVRALFRAFTPGGAPPVDAPGTRFASLTERLQPDAARAIELVIQREDDETISTARNEEDAPPMSAQVGDTVRLRVGPVIDWNGNQAPDGTVVEFQARYEGEETALSIDPAVTRAGIAQRDLLLERDGIVRLTASAGDATTGEPLGLVVEESLGDVAIPPLGSDTAITNSLGSLTDSTASENATAAGDNGQRVNFATLVITLFTMGATLGLLLSVQVRVLPRRTVVFSMLWALIFGFAAYILYGLGLFPGGTWLYATLKIWGAAAAVFVTMLFPLLWLQLRAD